MTSALLRGKDLIGKPVVDIATGTLQAEIRDVVFDAAAGSITGFTLRKPGFLGRRLKAVLAIDSVRSVGADAVIVETAGLLANPDDVPEASGEDKADVVGDRVITESGRVLGELRDVIIVGGRSARVVGFEIGGGPTGDGLIPIAAASGLSGSSLIVPDIYEQRIRTDLTGLAAELATIEKDRT